MSHRAVPTVLAVLTLCAAIASPCLARTLSFDERVDAQRAIERVYHANRTGPPPAFEEAVPDDLLRAKVRRTLGRSAALEQVWGRPVTGEMLRREVERMARDTRMPARLEALFAALGDDAFLVQETLARERLVERLTAGYLAFDDRLHGAARREAERLWNGLVRGEIDPRVDHPHRRVVELTRAGSVPSATDPHRGRRPGVTPLRDEEFEAARARLAGQPGGIGPLREARGGFVVEVLLEDGADALRLARFAVDKADRAGLWDAIAGSVDWRAVSPVASPDTPLPRPAASGFAGAQTCGGEWRELARAMPQARIDHTAVWTGTEMIVWGGTPSSLDPGERYDPALDTWQATSTVGAPEQDAGHAAVWTGAEMIVWSGSGDPDRSGRYDPATDTWAPLSATGAPAPREDFTAVWTGSEMIVWGGGVSNAPLDTGGRYDPVTDTWSPTSTAGAPAARLAHTAVWTGSEMIVWGGGVDLWHPSDPCPFLGGGRYDPATDSWAPLSTTNEPRPRVFHSMIWTGSEAVVWGGSTCGREDRDGYNTGGRYDPATDTWTATSVSGTPGAPGGRLLHTATWTGSAMLVWGGNSGENYSQLVDALDDGGLYDPAADTWAALPTPNAPEARAGHTAVWTGQDVIVWGGFNSAEERLESGGRYRPSTGSWLPTTSSPVPSGSGAGVWTGSEWVIWGGAFERYGESPVVFDYLPTGSRYDPATDSWSPTTTSGAPEGREYHTAVWTGSEVIVWGGEHADTGTLLASGGRYDPVADAWTPTSTAGAPALSRHTAVWTGSEMIVWGGDLFASAQPAARYAPASDTWTLSTTTGAPEGRWDHSAVWTGSEMIVWGGSVWNAGVEYGVATGAHYDPVADAWAPTATTGAPDKRMWHSAVWTGSEMIVWGGAWEDGTGTGNYDTGGRYDPVAGTWTPMATAGAPSGRVWQGAVWTGDEMIVWSGQDGAPGLVSGSMDTGGRYDPATDSWAPTPLTGNPDGRHRPVTAWTGSEMLAFGGFSHSYDTSSGSALTPGLPDNDLDGFCDADCDPSNPDVHPGAAEVNDGVDNQCPGDPGYGAVDEVSGPMGMDGSGELTWTPQAGATSYEVARSTSADFTTDCSVTPVAGPPWTDPDVPPPGVAFHYLVRAASPNAGTWGLTSAGAERTVCD